ncbi:hypothetical protein WJX72_003645 [[Myrmecia] bisecta]|uniref:Thioredoxin domain-containing protein n=1 Tax=[Myrmecia] bisecta TaxID=41462 RepID=A0AAW1P9P3_9CHLO
MVSGTPLSTSSSSAVAELVTTVHSPEEFEELLAQHPGQLVVLMCKAMACRPCKMFSRKYQRMAGAFQDCVFVDILGDESRETRNMMIKMNVRVTPTFRLYRNGEFVHSLGGINENNLRGAIEERLLPGEAGAQADASGDGATTASPAST